MNNIFLTFDMDWADDGVLTHFLNLMNDKDLTGTLKREFGKEKQR